MTADPPLVSLGLPVYNGERYLEETLASILGQTMGRFELIISDNGSTDGTERICRAHAERDRRIRYLRAERNRGASWNFNRVARLATAPYFKWASADDLLAPTYLEACVNTLEAAPASVVLCYPRTALIDSDGTVVEHYQDRMDVRHPQPRERLRHVLRHLRLCNAVFGMSRREVFLSTSLLAPYHSSDVVLLAELALRGQIWEVPERLFLRRRPEEPDARHRLTQVEKIRWFDPSRRLRYPFIRTRLFAEHARSIMAASLPLTERVRCLGVLASEWGPRYWRNVGGEFKRAVLGTLRAARD